MPWRPLSRIVFAVAIYPFQPSSPADLPLELGDELYIIEQGGVDGSWFRGYLVAPPSLLAGLSCVKGRTLEARVFSGIFPRTCVEVREVLGDNGVNEHGQEEEHINGYINGDYTNGDRHHVQSTLEQYGNERQRSKMTPVKGQRSTAESAPARRSGASQGVSSASSPPATGKLNSQSLARKVSVRSVSGRMSVGPTLPLTPISMIERDPGVPRPSAPVPMLKIGDETPTSTSEPLVDEIASCLREWHSTYLHELLLSRRYSVLETMSALVKQLDLSRRQLLHGVLTSQELSDLREMTIWNLVNGNKILSNEVIVRDPRQHGRLLTGDDSVIDVSDLQATMSLLDKPPKSLQDSVKLNHLMVDIREVSNRVGESPSLLVYLCLKTPGQRLKPLSETFALDCPPDGQFNKASLAGKLRTLYIDLTPGDVGDVSGADSLLYLAVRVQTNELTQPSALTPSKTAMNREPSSRDTAAVENDSPSPVGSNAGRRSLMWAQRQMSSSYRKRSQGLLISRLAQSPINGQSLTPVDEATTNISLSARPPSQRPPSQQGPQFVKRNLGVGVLNLKDMFGQSKDVDQTMTIWSPAEASTEDRKQEQVWDEIVQELMTSTTGRFVKCKFVDYIGINLRSFITDDANTLIRSTPTILHNISQTPRIGFSGAPTKPRSDIYLTISEAFLPAQALLSHPTSGTVPMATNSNMRNIQLTLEVRKETGERIDRCIFPSSTSTGQTAWRTAVAGRGEAWNQTIKLVIPTHEVPRAHLIMSVADSPGFPFALCWMPLWSQQAFMKDGAHSLLLYAYDKLTSSTEDGKGAYLQFPWNSKAKDDSVRDESLTGPIATLVLETYLCSTVFSQNEVLLSILRWREQPEALLAETLKQMNFVPEIEVVKQLNDVFDALFSILVDGSRNDELEHLVFNALVTVLSIVQDRRFNLGPLVDEYANNRFHYPFAAPCLIKSYRRLLSSTADLQNSRQLRATFKVGRHVLKFIANARKQQEVKEAGIGITATQSSFSRDIRSLFRAMEVLMKDHSAILIGTKTLVVQHIHTWLPELIGCLDEAEILQIATDFLDACADVKGKLILYKLVLIQNLPKAIPLSQNDLKQRLFLETSKWISPYWGSSQYVTEQWREQVRLCCSIVSSQVDVRHSQSSSFFSKVIHSYLSIQLTDRHPKENLSILFPTAYPFPIKAIKSAPSFDESLIELAAVLTTLSNKHLAEYLNSLGSELVDILTAALEVNLSVLSNGAFPTSWLTLHVYHHHSTLRILGSVFEVMVKRCLPSPDDADDFDTNLWKLFLTTLLKLVRSDALALETFPEQKRRAIWKIAGDVREHGANLLRRSWESIGWETNSDERRQFGLLRLGGYQVQYVPTLVASIVELCLSVHEGLRGAAVSILQSMIISEWTLNEDLSVIQAEVIECLNHMFELGNVGESIQQKIFVGELLDLFKPLAGIPQDPLWEALKGLVFTTDELLDLLVAVYDAEATEAYRLMHTLRLMDFLKDVEKEDIFIRYVHQLAEIQARSRNPTEAGLALRLHADLYAWDSNLAVKALIDPVFPEQSSFDRKEQLYFEMINFFEEGGAWECAIDSYRELADHYEQYTFDFAKLARTQRSMAKIYDVIARGERVSPRYFHVTYRGLGFPALLRDKQFIYQGNGSERLSAFTDRLQQEHLAAQISSGDNDNLEGQYIQVSAVSPHRDLEHPLYQRAKVPQPTREYILSSQPSQFAITSRRHSPKSGVKDQWVEKTIYTTADSFPTILRRSEVVSIDLVTLSPLQTALERTTRKTSELNTLEKRIADGDEFGLISLTTAIKSSVDASSPTSVAQYRELLTPTNDDEPAEPKFPGLENALKNALLDHASTLRHSLTLFSRPASQATQADLSYQLALAFAPELAILHPNPRPSTPSPQITSWLPILSTPPSLALNRASSSIRRSTSNRVRNGDHTNFASSAPTDIAFSRPDLQSNNSLNRLSLSFLKRSTSSDDRPKTNGVISSESISSKTNGVDISIPNGDASSSRTTSGSRAENSRLMVFHDSKDAAVSRASHSRGEGVGKRDKGDNRPNTADETGTEVRAKKRLSLLGIGKKGSKGSFGGSSGGGADRVGSVREE